MSAWLSHWASSAPWMLFDKLDQPMKFYMLFARVHHTHVHREREREKEWGEQTTNTPLHIEGSDAQYCRMALLIGWLFWMHSVWTFMGEFYVLSFPTTLYTTWCRWQCPFKTQVAGKRSITSCTKWAWQSRYICVDIFVSWMCSWT